MEFLPNSMWKSENLGKTEKSWIEVIAAINWWKSDNWHPRTQRIHNVACSCCRQWQSVHHPDPESCRESHLIPKFEWKSSHSQNLTCALIVDETRATQSRIFWVQQLLRRRSVDPGRTTGSQTIRSHKAKSSPCPASPQERRASFRIFRKHKLCHWESRRRQVEESSSPFSSVRLYSDWITVEWFFEYVKHSLTERSKYRIGGIKLQR